MIRYILFNPVPLLKSQQNNTGSKNQNLIHKWYAIVGVLSLSEYLPSTTRANG